MELDLSNAADLQVIVRFLRDRCSKEFLELFLKSVPKFTRKLEYKSWLVYSHPVHLVAKLNCLGLLPEMERRRISNRLIALCLMHCDGGIFNDQKIKALLTSSEQLELSRKLKKVMFGKLRDQITSIRDECITEKETAWGRFVHIENNISAFAKEFQNADILRRFAKIRSRISALELSISRKVRRTKGDITSSEDEELVSTRSIFDDVEE